jgi:cystathionine beta-lyase/cystathionine gamma-synthase
MRWQRLPTFFPPQTDTHTPCVAAEFTVLCHASPDHQSCLLLRRRLLLLLLQMALRMERSIDNAEKIAEFLAGHPLVRKLNYAGRPEHAGADVHAAQSTSGGAMISFETGGCCSCS